MTNNSGIKMPFSAVIRPPCTAPKARASSSSNPAANPAVGGYKAKTKPPDALAIISEYVGSTADEVSKAGSPMTIHVLAQAKMKAMCSDNLDERQEDNNHRPHHKKNRHISYRRWTRTQPTVSTH